MKHNMERLSAILRLLKTRHLPVPIPIKESHKALRLAQHRKPTHLLHAHELVRARSWPSH